MKGSIQDVKLLSGLRPLDLIAYLRANQWQEAQKLENGAFWTKEDQEILLPLDATLKDFPNRMAEALGILEHVEKRSQFEIFEDLVITNADVIRPRLIGVNGDGSISLEQGTAIHQEARNLMLAAACSTIEKKSLFAKRKPEQAMNYLNHARFGIPQRGSYILTIISPVSPKIAAGKDLFGKELEPEEPFERKTVKTLARALHAAEQACREVAASSNIEPMKKAVASGVSANLCEAIIGLYRASGDKGIQFGFSWTPMRGVPADVVSNISISSDAIPFLEETARVFRETEAVDDSEVLGTVNKLEHQDGEQGKVTLAGSVEGVPRRVIMELSGVDHQNAIRSYKERVPMVCVGTLVREGRSWVLKSPREVRLIEGEQ